MYTIVVDVLFAISLAQFNVFEDTKVIELDNGSQSQEYVERKKNVHQNYFELHNISTSSDK